MNKQSEMRKLTRNECAILPLVLKSKWYDMIASGRKTEEYREKKPYWAKRIMRWLYDPRETHVVQFSRGYRKADMFFIGCVSFNTYIGTEHPEWGEPEAEHYKIHLLERIVLEGRQPLGKPKESKNK